MLTPKRDEFAVDNSAVVDKVHGVRLRLLRDGAEVDSTTLWSEPGRPVEGAMFIELNASEGVDHDGTHPS